MLSIVETYLHLMMVDFIAHHVCYNVIGYESLREWWWMNYLQIINTIDMILHI